MNRHFVRSAFALGISQLITWTCTASLVILLPRYLGDVNLGKLGFAMAFTGLLGVMAELGTATYLTKEIARNPTRAGVLTTNALAMRFPMSAAVAAIAVAVVNLSGYDEVTRHLVYLFCIGLLVDALAKIVLGALQGLQRMRSLAAGSVLSKVTFAGLAFVMVLSGEGGAVEVAYIHVFSSLLALGCGLLILLRLGRLPLTVDWSSWRFIFMGGLPFFLWQASFMVYAHIDMVLLSFLANHAVVGWYGAAYKIVMLPAFVPTIVMTVTFPALVAAASNPALFNTLARQAAHIILLASVPMAIGIMLLADKIIALFGYPEVFNNSAILMVLLAPCIVLAGVDTIIGNVLTARDRQRQWALTGVAAAVLNPLLNLVAIPYTQAAYGNGAIGAAAITTLTEVFMMSVGLWLLPSGVFNGRMLANALKCLAVGLGMAVFVGLTRDHPLVVPILLGALVYGGGCLASGILSLDDLRLVARQLTARVTTPVEPKTQKLAPET